MTKSARKKRTKPDSDDTQLTPSATSVPPSDRCWKCKGKGLKFQKSTQAYDGPPCKVCNGEGIRKRSKRSKVLASAPGKILNLRGYPEDHPLRKIFPDGFAGPRAFWGSASESDRHSHGYDDLADELRPREGEIVGSLGCGDWRIYQIADGNKLTVDDFVCAWVAAEEMRKRGYGVQLHRGNASIEGHDRQDDGKMFGGRPRKSDCDEKNDPFFHHADIGTGCGSVLMMMAWAFLGEIQSIGVEAQSISFNCLRRGLEWNLGRDGTSSKDVVQIRQNDLRTWDGCGVSDQEVPKAGTGAIAPSGNGKNDQSPSLRPPYHLITGTPPYFPLDSFVASENHEQKVRCRVPTRGGAPDYIETASRFLMEEKCNNESTEGEDTVNSVDDGCPIENSSEGVFCMVEASFDKAEAGVLDAVKKFNMRVRRRVDVVTRVGLPPRFSCWVMTKKNTESDAKTTKNLEEKSNDDDDVTFPIEIFTLRNADFSRTKQYTDAMEIMGWVDFEKSKLKTDKSMKEIIGNDENI